MKTQLRIAIVGAGVLGAASAYILTRKFEDRVRVTVIERHSSPALETSGRNSGVLHSGIHEHPNSLKGRFARKGNGLARQFAGSHPDIPILHCGMIIVASSHDIVHILRHGKNFLRIYRNGRAQHIEMRLVAPWEIRTIEPHVQGLGGLFIPSVAVIDSVAFVEELLKEARRRATRTLFGETIQYIIKKDGIYYLETENHMIEADAVVNAAGIYADELAAQAGFPYYTITPWRGEYYEILGAERDYVNRLVYPVPVEHRVGKGIHLLKRPDGRLFVGPNAREVPTKDFYEEDKTPTEVFREVAARFCPALRDAEFRWGYSGIRPKGFLRHAPHKNQDFIFSVDNRSPFFLNVIGYESPGLSGALAAAEYIAGMLVADYPHLAS